MTINYAGVNHAVLVTNDMDATVRFYRDVLQMPLVVTMGNRKAEFPHRHYFFSIGRGMPTSRRRSRGSQPRATSNERVATVTGCSVTCRCGK